MKIKEMVNECRRNKGICKNCKLNCITDWLETEQPWCMLQVRINYIKAYQEYKAENNEILAERTRKRYEELEKKYLGENK